MRAQSPSLNIGLLCMAAALWALAASVAGAATLDTIKQRGALTCGVSQGLPGFSDRDGQGNWSGFDVDFCRAVAAAVFNDPKKVTFVPLSALERFDALKDGKIDVLSRNSTWTLDREAGSGMLFAAVIYYDGQGFMVARRLQVTSALELDKASICVQKGTTTELNLADYFRTNSMTYRELAFDTLGDAIKAFDSGQCDVFTADQSALYAERLGLTKPEVRGDPSGRDLQGALGTRGAQRRHHMVQHREMGWLRARRRGRARNRREQCVRGAGLYEA